MAIKMYKTIRFVQMKTLSLSEFRAHASEMVDLVQRGETVRILRHGKPVAELVPVRGDEARVPSWKRPFDAVPAPQGKTLAQRIVEERAGGAGEGA